MVKKILLLLASIACLSLSQPACAAALTEIETAWLKAGLPVLAFAKEIKLPVDIIVQPEAKAGDVPLAMGFQDGRCKLVLSMRGNPDAETVLANVPNEERAVLIEAMTAHELGHCWRYAHGNWRSLPVGFVEVGEEYAADKALLKQRQEMRETRREEGYADLVALAWTQHHHPEQYAHVIAWFEQVRHDQPVAGNSHDTRAWIKLAKDGSVFGAADSPFEQVVTLWNQGLLGDS